MALQDESFEIRENVIALLGRLCDVNPAYIMPTLRKVLLQLMSELEHSGIYRQKEQSARLISQIVATAPQFVKPYVSSMFKVIFSSFVHLENISALF